MALSGSQVTRIGGTNPWHAYAGFSAKAASIDISESYGLTGTIVSTFGLSSELVSTYGVGSTITTTKGITGAIVSTLGLDSGTH